VWQGSAGDRRPYADQTGFEEITPDKSASRHNSMIRYVPGNMHGSMRVYRSESRLLPTSHNAASGRPAKNV